MKIYIKLISILFISLYLSSCQKDQLEEYFVKASENPDFFVVNIPANMIKFNEEKLDKKTKKQLKSISKLNVILYKNDYKRQKKEEEFLKLKKIIKSKKYKTLLKINNKGYDIDFSYLGKPEMINKVILLGNDKQYNFILGLLKAKDIDINNVAKALRNIKSVDETQFESIIDIIDTKK